ncbi:MAG: YbbR-like domain-containing protein [Candidatus Omnitrophota bacterium]
MLRLAKKYISENLILKILSLVIAVGVWIYVIGELGKGALEQQRFLEKIFPTYGMMAKNLMIKPRLVGAPRRRYEVINDMIVVVPEDCIVVGPKRILENIESIDTATIDIDGMDKTFTRSVPLKPIASGVYFEETVAMVTVPIEREGKN